MPVINIYPSDDSFGRQNVPDGNYGANTTIEISRGLGQDRHAYIKFNMADVLLGSTIKSAILNLYLATHKGGNVVTYLMDGNWVEGTITYNNAPGILGGNLKTWDTASDGWKTADLTATFKNWFKQTTNNYGIKLYSTIDTSVSGQPNVFNSSENANGRPYFAVDYQPPGSFVYNMI